MNNITKYDDKLNILGSIFTIVGIAALAISCFMALKRMQKLQDMSFKQRHPEEYKKLKSNISSYIIMAVGIFGFILGFIFLNFV